MSALYPKAKEQMLQAGINMSSGVIKAVGVNISGAGTLYVFSAAHDFLDDVTVASRVGTPQTLANKTFVNGVFDADDIAFPSVSGDSIEALVIWIDTGVESTSKLIAYIDGVSVTPNGGNINVTWDNGSNKIFAL
jgi:hypothetical protein